MVDERAAQLEAEATRVQQRGPVTDYFGCGPKKRFFGPDGHRYGRVALCRCVHGKEWPEGGWDAPEKVCRECSEASLAALRIS